MPGAEVSASTAPGNVVKTRSDGSFTLQVKEHTGTFTLTVKKAGYASVTISIGAEKSNQTVPMIQLAKTYTTTVRGKVVTPAKAADPTKGSAIATARVWASTDPTKKIDVGTDGSYTLQVANHTGNFTITAEYTATGNRNYKTSDPKNVTTKGAAIENQYIALNYGYTTEVTVQVALYPTGAAPIIANGVEIVITANTTTEQGHVVGRGTTSGTARNAVIRVDHPGMIRVTASNTGYSSASSDRTLTEDNIGVVMNLFPYRPRIFRRPAGVNLPAAGRPTPGGPAGEGWGTVGIKPALSMLSAGGMPDGVSSALPSQHIETPRRKRLKGNWKLL